MGKNNTNLERDKLSNCGTPFEIPTHARYILPFSKKFMCWRSGRNLIFEDPQHLARVAEAILIHYTFGIIKQEYRIGSFTGKMTKSRGRISKLIFIDKLLTNEPNPQPIYSASPNRPILKYDYGQHDKKRPIVTKRQLFRFVIASYYAMLPAIQHHNYMEYSIDNDVNQGRLNLWS
ncbi:MAG: hypothetical protein K0U41_06515 [Gammaproteobacteria bacterium]|nr:hypothetical protein [Gammaproteobacteria bacterium]